MTTMIAAAGSPEDEVRTAAEAIAGYENRFISIDQRFAKLEGALNQRALPSWRVLSTSDLPGSKAT